MCFKKQNRNPALAVTILKGGATEKPNCKPTKCLQFGNEERPLLSRWSRLRDHLTSKGHFWVVPVAGVEPARLLCRGILRLVSHTEDSGSTRNYRFKTYWKSMLFTVFWKNRNHLDSCDFSEFDGIGETMERTNQAVFLPMTISKWKGSLWKKTNHIIRRCFKSIRML